MYATISMFLQLFKIHRSANGTFAPDFTSICLLIYLSYIRLNGFRRKTKLRVALISKSGLGPCWTRLFRSLARRRCGVHTAFGGGRSVCDARDITVRRRKYTGSAYLRDRGVYTRGRRLIMHALSAPPPPPPPPPGRPRVRALLLHSVDLKMQAAEHNGGYRGAPS